MSHDTRLAEADRDRLLAVVDRFARCRVAVVGDFVADEFLYGRVARVSREAPVLILEYDKTDVVPGGAGNAANNVAALGAGWWIFTRVLDFSALDHTTPLYSFLFLVALGVDYNIFVVTRAWEETPSHGTREGMLRALAATGGVITSAGILLAAVFAVLGVLPLVVLAQVGVVICIGVLLDTLLVRTVLVPALALILGDRFWWPRRIPAGARS